MLANRKPTLVVQCKLVFRLLPLVAFVALTLVDSAPAKAQRTRFNDAFQVNPGIVQPQPIQPGAVFGGTILPSTQPPITVLPPAQSFPAPNVFNGPVVAPQPSFDPFRTPNNPFPSFPQPAPAVPQPTRQFGLPNPAPFNADSGDFSLINRWPNANTAWPSQTWARLQRDVFPRLFERPRFRHTYLEGGDNSQLNINDTELATTVTFPNWFGSSQPLRLSPGFIFHFWDGPNTEETGFDLPSRAFSVYLAADYSSNPKANAGFETNLTVGLYSDFRNSSSDGIRLTGTGLLWKRINSYTTFKIGAEYLDRVDVKLLPAIGVFLAPNPDLRLDVYFPRPKLAQRLPRIGRFEVWSYIGAEYGGGSWAIERTPLVGDDFDDQADINDVRAFVGLEWMGPRRITGFLELGYAFERELLYRSDPDNELELNDAFMLRTGVAF